MEFLQTILSDGKSLPTMDIKREAEARGIGEKALKKARNLCNIVMIRGTDGVCKWKISQEKKTEN